MYPCHWIGIENLGKLYTHRQGVISLPIPSFLEVINWNIFWEWTRKTNLLIILGWYVLSSVLNYDTYGGISNGKCFIGVMRKSPLWWAKFEVSKVRAFLHIMVRIILGIPLNTEASLDTLITYVMFLYPNFYHPEVWTHIKMNALLWWICYPSPWYK